MAKKKPPEEEGAPGWMTTYADLMSLLLCFFVMLFSISIIAPRRWQAVADTLQQDFMGHSGSSTTASPKVRTTVTPAESAAKSRRVAELIGGQPTPGPKGDASEVHTILLDGETVKLIRFAPGRSELTDQAKLELLMVLPDLRGSPKKIMIKGRVAPTEGTGTFRQETDLAFFRALEVVEHFVTLGLSQDNFEIVVDTSTVPRLNVLPPGTDPSLAGASVEIILLNQTTRSLQE